MGWETSVTSTALLSCYKMKGIGNQCDWYRYTNVVIFKNKKGVVNQCNWYRYTNVVICRIKGWVTSVTGTHYNNLIIWL